MSSYSELYNRLEDAWLVLCGGERGRVSLGLRSLFPHLSSRSELLRLITACWDHLKELTSSHVPLELCPSEYFWTSMILVFPKTVLLGTHLHPLGRREFIAADLSPPAKKSSWYPAAPSPSQDQFCRDNWWLLHQVFLLSVNTLPRSQH